MYIGLASDFSFLAGELRAAGTAADFLCKAVGGIEERGSAFQLCLDLCVGVAVDDCLMAVSHVIPVSYTHLDVYKRQQLHEEADEKKEDE